VTRYAEDSKERVRAAADIVQVVQARVDLRRRGHNSFWGRCPFHEERTPSFHVRPAEGTYFCFGCQRKGDVFSFVMETEALPFPEALEQLAERFGVELEAVDEDPEAARRRARQARLLEVLDRAAAWYERYLWESEEAAPARGYLLGRGLAEEILRGFRVGYAPAAWDRVLAGSRSAGYSEDELLAAGLVQRGRGGRSWDRFRERIVFPLADERGRVRGFGARAMGEGQGPKYLNSSEGEVFHKGRELFGLDRARRAAAAEGAVVLAEGYTDVVALHQAGVPNAVGLMGTALTEEQVAALARTARTLVFALDADAAGQEAVLKGAELARRRQLELRVVALPEGRDPADLLVDEGGDALRARVGRSVPWVVFRVERVLGRADTGSAEGRDRALAALRPIVRGLEATVLREELIRRIAGHLELSEALVATLGDVRVARAADNGAVAPSPARPSRREEAERTFLALCLARPTEGAAALGRMDLDAHFANDATRRAARHVLAHPSDPLGAAPEDEPELGGLLAELVARCGDVPVSPESLEHAELLLELARLQRAMAAARAERTLEIPALAQRRNEVKRRIGELSELLERQA
jgi:DNA primase